MTTIAQTDSEPSTLPKTPENRTRLVEASSDLSTLALGCMIVLAAIAMVGTLPGRTHGLGLITEGLLQDFALGRSRFAQINLVATLIGSIFCWPCGWLLDRLGIRLTSCAVLILLGISTLGISLTRSTIALCVWITLTRGFGQSMLSVVSITLSGKSSIGPRQPIAMAGFSLFVSLFFIAAFSLMGIAIPAAGWRAAWASLGWIVVIAGPIFGLLVIEPNVASSNEHARNDQPGSSATLRQALSSPGFWVFALTSALYALIASGLSLFNQSILAERHFDAHVFYTLLKISTFSGLISNLITGWLAKSVTYGRLMAVAMTLYTLALVAFPFVSSLAHVYAYGVAMGLCGRIVTVVFFGVWSHAYGRNHLGQIQGVAQAATVLASAVGPLAFAECLKWTGSYVPAFWTLAPCVACLAITAWIVPTPKAIPGRWSSTLVHCDS